MAVHDVFISYSSADLALAESIHRGLELAELRVWRDRDRLEPGLRFTSRIFDALRESRICLCLVSEAYLRSGYANQEAGAAYSFGVRLFPLRIGSIAYDRLAGVISDTHVPAFGQDIPDVDSLVTAVSREIIDASRGIRGSAAPPLPRHHVERAELSAAIAALVRKSNPWFAITGLPGSGRTTFAAALGAAIAPSVDERVFWVERQTADFGLTVQLQRQLLDQLTDESPAFDTWQNGRRLLRRFSAAFPRNARCVVFLDNADSEPDILRGFDIDSRWTVVAVGQDPSLFASKVPPECMVRLGGLSFEEAEELAARTAGVSPEALTHDARALLERMDRLPAAIVLAATLARESIEPGVAWRDLLDSLEEGLLKELSHPGVLRGGVPALVQAALRPLDPRQRKALASLGVLPDGSPLDLSMLGRVWNREKERHTRALASRLRDLSLLAGGPSDFRMPSLIRSYVRQQPRFAALYIGVIASVFPTLDPLIAATAWNDRDLFDLLIKAHSRSGRTRRALSRSRRPSARVTLDAQFSGFQALHFAVQGRQLEMAAKLLQAGATVDVPSDPQGQTALHLAVHHSQPGIAALLLDAGADPNWRDAQGIAPLHVAAQFDAVEIATMLLEHGADPRGMNARGNRPLHLAAVFDGARVAALLTSRYSDVVGLENADGVRPLLVAALKGHARTLSVLLRAGASPDDAHPSGDSALHVAVRGGHRDAVDTLLVHYATVDAISDGVTPLYLAAQEGQTSLVTRLLDAGADPSGGRLSSSGTSAIHIAAQNGYEDVARLLVRAGASVDTVDSAGRTPLHFAAQFSSVSFSSSARISMAEEGGRVSALTVSARVETAAIVDYLLSAGAPVNAPDANANTALHIAANAGATAAVHSLLTAGADRALRNAQGLTAADVARAGGRGQIADAIEARQAVADVGR